MKAFFGVLLCLAFTCAQAFAISGGPDYGGGGQVSTTGIYAGILMPSNSDNSLALFTVPIPKSGIGSGTFAIFRNGLFYPGTFQGIADPDSAKMTGVIDAKFERTVATKVTDTSTETFVYTYYANGSVEARIKANTNLFSSASARLDGQGKVTFTNTEGKPAGSSDGPVIYDVIGFKQAEATSL